MRANSSLATPEFDLVRNERTVTLPWVEILVGALFALSWVGLCHDYENLATRVELSVEAGRGIEDVEAFRENVNAAPLRRKLGFLGLLVVGAYCFMTAPRGAKLHNFVVLLMLGSCLAWLAVSFTWSDDMRGTLREFVRVGAYAFVALSMVLRFPPRQLCIVMMIGMLGSVMVACGASVMAGNFRPWQSDFRLHGTIHSNLLSHQAMFVLLIAVALQPNSRKVWFWRVVIVSMLTVILLTKTRGALASGLLGIAAIKLISRSFWSATLISSLLASAVFAAIFLLVAAGPHFRGRVQEVFALGRSEGVGTLTGRIPLWNAVLKESQDNRVQGYGYGAFWTTDRTRVLAKHLEWSPRHAHSAYMHILLDLGYVGLALLLILVLASMMAALQTFRITGESAYAFYFGLLGAGLLDGFVEVSYVSPRELGLLVGIAIISLIVVHPSVKDEMERELAEEPATDLNQASAVAARLTGPVKLRPA